MPLESKPVTTAHKLADIADWTSAHQLGQLEDLGYGQDRAFRRVLASSAPDTAWIAGENLVLFHGGHQHGAQEPVCLGRHRG